MILVLCARRVMPGVMPLISLIPSMVDETQKLIDLLEAAERLLRSHGVTFWADWLSRDVSYLKAGDFHGVEDLLGAYGGMGSLTDVFICPENGDNIRKDEVAEVNGRLDELRAALYTLAEQIRHEGHLPHRAA